MAKPPNATPPRSFYIPHDRVQKDPGGPSRTKQSFREECEITNILAKYEKTGIIQHMAKHGPTYPDMPTMLDFHDAMNLVTSASSMFEELPSAVRSRFRNDPALFLDFVSDPDNNEAMIEMGLAVRQPDPEPIQATRVPEATPDEPEAPETAP